MIYRKHALSDIDWKEMSIRYGIAAMPMVVYAALSSFAESVILCMIAFLITMVLFTGVYKGVLNQRRHESSKLEIKEALYLFVTQILLGGLSAFLLLPGILVSGAIGKICIALGVVAVAFGLLVFSQSPFLAIDGKTPIKALIKSVQMIREDAREYILMILPLIGWMLLGAAAGGFLVALLVMIGNSLVWVSIIGLYVLRPAMVLLFMTAIAPPILYMLMSQAEFYDSLNGMEMNELKEPDPFRTEWLKYSMFLLSAIIIVLISLVLPVNQIPMTLL